MRIIAGTGVNFVLICNDARPTCFPLLPGQTYELEEVHPGDADYAYGYLRKPYHASTMRVRGGTHDAVYALMVSTNAPVQ